MGLSVQDVSRQYPTPGEPLVVLRGATLAMEPGDSLAIVGPSGSGKSTLLSILGALDPPTAGRVELDGVDPFTLDEPGLARFRNERVGFVFQDHYLLPQCTVLENVLVPKLAAGGSSDADRQQAEALLNRVGLGDRLTHRPAELSGGERQRAALARALVNRPALLLADEPTGNLDRQSAENVGELLLEMSRQQETMLVVVTHSQELAAVMARRMRLDDGRLSPID
ncbi:Lipoprotein-releasing system ATP-binding protein LolD [Pirellulimonas nuda]|uniref:Lipoprotein-releasing system ATP-binding protein LolD n=1 Tax=Pirellulimonas nuda TaxID=2528009 RepID=A0A518D9Y4_9BACT|nr:ABC transporter ATP-binding protein [Pirellulimonas nuda]QDU88292.1 Lipoprotein-releasing system ATP-binding protein LolD [Pirellulimonas nuda]